MPSAEPPAATPVALPSALTFAQVWACYRRYEALLPAIGPARATVRVRDLGALAGDFEAFVFDAYGVLNRGHQPIAGAAHRFAQVLATDKPVVVLTNDASGNVGSIVSKHAARGFDLTRATVVAGLDVLPMHLEASPNAHRFGYLGPSPRPHPQHLDGLADLSRPGCDLDALDGFILLEHPRWDAQLQSRLLTTLTRRARPVLIGNPDITAPVGDTFTVEPGYLALQLWLRTGVRPTLFGKPAADVYQRVTRVLRGIEPRRVLAIGDTLHTDTLGARNAGFATLLVESGILRGRDSAHHIAECGICPDFVCASI